MSGTVVRRIGVAAMIGLAAASLWVGGGVRHVRAAGSFQIQTMDSCNQAIGGATFELLPGGTTQAALPGGPKHVGGTGCLERGNCGAVSIGCVTFTTPAPGSYTIDETVNPPNYAACQGGSACPPPLTGASSPQIASITVDALSNVTATVTNHAPDGSATTAPKVGTFSGAPTDPIVFHNFGLGPGICDGDNDYDDALTGGPGSHCDAAGNESGADRGFVNLTIAAPSGGQIQSGTQFAVLPKIPLNPGGAAAASVAVIAGVGDPPNVNPPMEVGNVGGALDAAVEGGAWQQLAAPGCQDAPAAYHNHADGLLYLACQTAGGLQFGTTPMTATASGTPAPTTMALIDNNGLPGGVALRHVGPAIAGLPSSGTVAIFAVGTDGNVYGRSVTGSSWTAITGLADGCAPTHIAAVLGMNGARTYVACTKVDGSAVLFATKTDATLSGYTAFTGGTVTPANAGAPPLFPSDQCSLPFPLVAGDIIDGPGAAATPGGVILAMRGNTGGMYEQAVVSTGSSVSTPQEYGPSYVGACGSGGHIDPQPAVSFSPGAASWMGAAVFLTVSPTSIPDGGSGTVNILVFNSGGGVPHSATHVNLSAPGGSGITFAQNSVSLVNGVGSTTINVAGNAPTTAQRISGAAGGSITGATGVAVVNIGGPPSVTSLSPPIGPTSGGATVTVRGGGFVAGSTSVFFGASLSGLVSVTGSGVLTAVAPAGAGVVDVTVTTPGGASPATPSDRYQYLTPPAQSRTQALTVVRYPSGLFTILARGRDGNVDSASQMPGGAWTPFVNLGGAPVTGVSAAINPQGTASGFYIGTDNQLHSATQMSNGVWTPWVNLGGALIGQPVAFAYPSGLFTAFARDMGNGSVDSASQNPDGTWTPWVNLGGSPASDITALRNSSGTVSGFYIGSEGHLHSASQMSNGVWTPWIDLGGALKGRPVAFTYPNGLFTAFARGQHGGVRSATQNPDGTWTPWADLGGSPNSDLSALISDSGTVSAFYIGSNHMFSASQMSNGVWTPWVDLGGNLSQEPTAVSFQNGLFSAFGINHSTRSANSASQFPNGAWTPWVNLGGSF